MAIEDNNFVVFGTESVEVGGGVCKVMGGGGGACCSFQSMKKGSSWEFLT